jgi:hypothetical protein
LLILILVATAWPQVVEEEYRVYTEHPRLFLNTKRLRLLKRERERLSLRWQQFDALMSGGARMPEPGFAHALYQVTGDLAPADCDRLGAGPASAKQRLLSMVSEPSHWRQSASRARIRTWIGKAATCEVAHAAIATIALADHDSQLTTWTSSEMVAWRNGARAVRKKSLNGEDVYRSRSPARRSGQLKIDLRENAQVLSRSSCQPSLSYYPASYPRENGTASPRGP